MKKGILSLLVLNLMLIAQPVFADEGLTSNIKYALKRSTESNYASVLIALGVVIVLIYITGIIYAKLNVIGYKTIKKQYKDMDDSKIIIRSTTQIGNNKSLHVIELGGKKMLIGVTNDSINLIKDLSENSDKRKTKSESESESEQKQCMLSKELSSQLPLDKLYNKDKDAYEDIEIENNAPQEEDNSNSQYNSEEFGLYKKYLD